MSICTLLSMASSVLPERLVFPRTSLAEMEADTRRGATWLRGRSPGSVVYLGPNSPLFATALFSAAGAGVPFVPLNYRLPAQALGRLLGRLDRPLIMAVPAYLTMVAGAGYPVVPTVDWLDEIRTSTTATDGPEADADSAAVLLFTSGTTADPKCVVLRHANLLSYVLGTVDLATADETDCALVCVPPYHIAGVGSALSNLYAGRRVVHLPDFDPAHWLRLVRMERVTTTMVVPTMLARIVDHLGGAPADCPTLRSLAYGGARMPRPVLEAALRAFPGTDFVNAYGLTETSSTIAVLGPDEHRVAFSSADPAALRRLASAGRLVPGVEAEVRDEDGTVLPHGQEGELWVRGPQISGEYQGMSSVLDPAGWFPTKDRASFDPEGYLYIAGRCDDVIIRGGENIAPAEVEDALLRHPAVSDVAVIGLPDREWGQRLVAVVVPRVGARVDVRAIREHARALLRGSRTPDEVIVRSELPQTPSGKVHRRRLVEMLGEESEIPA
ncbi:fatty acid--CoA ligase family protein [Nocardia sp. CA2R105]|uniref:class I adenylate-forming enzyme family protein n=1 Tax=Nocardia coffeae TaxID=2873381 RepID=UPI001CA62F63|nr:fatty acid--CoA ligase family protein [Nocardia coffeae]MBY8856800.1 fatty acid--CoA ligase family protein [Nocardia coffeae]